jgi:hypothetical protein
VVATAIVIAAYEGQAESSAGKTELARMDSSGVVTGAPALAKASRDELVPRAAQFEIARLRDEVAKLKGVKQPPKTAIDRTNRRCVLATSSCSLGPRTCYERMPVELPQMSGVFELNAVAVAAVMLEVQQRWEQTVRSLYVRPLSRARQRAEAASPGRTSRRAQAVVEPRHRCATASDATFRDTLQPPILPA